MQEIGQSQLGYLAIEKLTALTGDHPEYLGWVALERVLNQKPRVYFHKSGFVGIPVGKENRETVLN